MKATKEDIMGKVGIAPCTTTLQLPTGQTIALSDWIDDKHWTTVELQNGDNDTLNAFSAGRSQVITGGARTNTLVDTNVPRNGDSGLPKDWEFMIYGWAMEIIRVCRPNQGAQNPVLQSYSDPVTLRTMFEIDRRLFCKYIYNAKAYSEGLFRDYPQGHGISLFTTNTTTELANNGVPSPRDRVALVLPVHERENLGYTMEITPVIPLAISQAALDGNEVLEFADLRVIKNGLIKRTVV
jgi:hypothetical protein